MLALVTIGLGESTVMSRRGMLGGVGALAAAALTGCSVLRKDRAELITEEVSSIDGVSGAKLKTGRDNRFHTYVVGMVDIDAASSAERFRVCDEVMRTAVTVLHERDEPEVKVGGLNGRLPDGTEITAVELDPDMPTEDFPLELVSAESLFPRYGLD